jgi:hypothetical protein
MARSLLSGAVLVAERVADRIDAVRLMVQAQIERRQNGDR